jgi:fucose permease
LPFVYTLWAWLFVALGLTLAILGPALPEMRAEFGVSLAASGLVFVMHSTGYFAGVLVASGLADTHGRKRVTSIGAAGLVAGMILAALAPSWPLVLAAIVIAGAGFALGDVGLNAAIGDAVEGAGKRAALMNLLHGAFPAGTLIAPAALALVLRFGLSWRLAFAGTAIGAAIALAGFLPGTPRWPATTHPSRPGGPKHLLRLLRDPVLRTLAIVQGLYVGVEVALSGWIASYLTEQFHAAPAEGALATSLFWGGFLIGRPVAAYLTHRFGPQRLLPCFCLAGVITVAAGVASSGAWWASAAYAAAGLGISGIFPTVMALALEGRTGDSGAATALMTGAASLGGLIWPWFVGFVAQEAGLRSAMATAGAPLAVTLVLALTLRTIVAPSLQPRPAPAAS